MVDLNSSTTGFVWKENATDMLLSKLDRNNNNTVDIEELVDYVFPRKDAMGGVAGATEYELVLEAFRRHDTNRNGTLDKAEFNHLMCAIKPGWSESMTDKVFNAVDTDRSGEVESDEIVAWLFGVPSDRKRAGQQMRRNSRIARRRGEEPPEMAAEPLVIFDFVCGKGQAEITVDRIARQWPDKLNGLVAVRKRVEGSSNSISSVSARDGKVVFWDAAAMMAFRDNPFISKESTDNWSKEMIARHIPRLISGT